MLHAHHPNREKESVWVGLPFTGARNGKQRYCSKRRVQLGLDQLKRKRQGRTRREKNDYCNGDLCNNLVPSTTVPPTTTTTSTSPPATVTTAVAPNDSKQDGKNPAADPTALFLSLAATAAVIAAWSSRRAEVRIVDLWGRLGRVYCNSGRDLLDRGEWSAAAAGQGWKARRVKVKNRGMNAVATPEVDRCHMDVFIVKLGVQKRGRLTDVWVPIDEAPFIILQRHACAVMKDRAENQKVVGTRRILATPERHGVDSPSQKDCCTVQGINASDVASLLGSCRYYSERVTTDGGVDEGL
ncbi:hypothetical protein PRIPAC_89888 [Pristionchus pacificus]|uniref:Uncharacterized protein n=1 Tax=Pristionchus pacificus TaxID=54126 RepID=A0A2A6B794_PRIPA|nr:hypothetical protein PRIPAC_89888 [Pristionchus pacificus]|eukprot:PDM61723.1 hypothetical protein PRIPAC_51165 [Pristionchus pacificus]